MKSLYNLIAKPIIKLQWWYNKSSSRESEKQNIRFIYADSAGKFENVALQNALVKTKLACKVIEVVFSVEKKRCLEISVPTSNREKLRSPKELWKEMSS